MRAAVYARLCLYAFPLSTGAQSFEASADQAQKQPLPKEQKPAASRNSGSAIVITGSRIPRTDLIAVSPITTVKGEEFRLEGATNAEEVLNQLPQVNPAESLFVNAGGSGAATIDLRGLGSVRTLVLVNGHRLMPGDPRYSVPDVNSVPTAIIERVEVMTGGAAAVYGSDAIAGVVNFIVDTKLNGLKLEAQVGAFQHNNRDDFARVLLDRRNFPYPTGSVLDGRRDNVSAAFGRSFFNDRAHVSIYGGYRRIRAVTQDRRDYGSCPITARDLASSILECGGPLVSYPGNFFDNLGDAYQVTSDRTFVPGISRFNYARWNYYQRPDTRYTAGGFANFDFSNSLQAYGEVMAMRDRSVWQIGPSGDFRDTKTINCDNALLADQQKSLICRNGNFVGQTPVLDEDGNLVTVTGSPTSFTDPVTGATYKRGWLLVSLRNVEGGSIQDDLKHKSIRLLGGVRGDLGRGVTYDAGYLFGRVRLDRQYRGNLSITRLGRALDVVADPSTGRPICRSALIARELGASASGADPACVPWDVFATGQMTPEATAYLSVPPSMRGSFSEQVGNVNATVDLDRWGIGSPWAAEPSVINLGSEYRKDAVEFDPDQFSQAGDIAGFGEQVFPIRGSIEAKELFAEARIPVLTGRLVDRLAFEAGFRRSRYSNARSSFSTNAYKVAVDLTAVRGLRFRASQQRANRAPNVLELLAPIQPDSFLHDPCAGTAPDASAELCARTGVTPAQYGHVPKGNGAVFEYDAITGGNEDLQPEAATTRTMGLVLQPRLLRGFSATIDWWDIKLKGAISRIGAQSIVDSCITSGDPIFCSRVHRDPNGSLLQGDGYVDDRQANLGGLKVRGIDGSAEYDLQLGRLGSAAFGFRGTYVLRWMVDNGGLSTPYDCAGLFGAPCSMQPRWKHTARATWNAPHGARLSVLWRHLGGVKLAALDPKFHLTDSVSPAYARLAPQDYFDVASAFRLRKRFELRMGINNVLDRQPPLVVSNTAAGDGPYNANTYPTWYDPLGRCIFAAVAIDLQP